MLVVSGDCMVILLSYSIENFKSLYTFPLSVKREFMLIISG